jgi:hypothetical protein
VSKHRGEVQVEVTGSPVRTTELAELRALDGSLEAVRHAVWIERAPVRAAEHEVEVEQLRRPGRRIVPPSS